MLLLATAGRGCPLSGLWYLAVFGSCPGSVPELAAAVLHSFSSSPSSSHVCAAPERPRSSETLSEDEEINRKKSAAMRRQLILLCFYKRNNSEFPQMSAALGILKNN